MPSTSKFSNAFLCVVAALALASCASRQAAPEAAPASATDSLTVRDATPADSAAGSQQAARAVVYFDFDSSDIRPEFHQALTEQVRTLSGNPRLAFRLEGHTDSRGSREYNIGLGERRAQSVRRFLTLNGASQDQLTTVSYGEERPAAEGDTESAWRQNRRVELVPFTR